MVLLRQAIEEKYDILIMDIQLAESEQSEDALNGMEISNRIKDIYPDITIIFMTETQVMKGSFKLWAVSICK